MRSNTHPYLCKLRTLSLCSDIVFESSASEGAILTMPRGARSEDLGNKATFREYTVAYVANLNWYRFVNGLHGREAKNDSDKTTSWGMANFCQSNTTK